MIKVRNFICSPCSRSEIAEFIERNHYSGSINGCIADFCFRLDRGEEMIGAAFFGRMAMRNQWKRFADSEDEVTELRRLCCVDDTPKNTESFFIGSMLRWLKKNTPIKVVVSYADLEHGHEGTIYKASNFEFDGFRKGAKVIVHNGRRYHDKAIRKTYKGELKPFAKRLKQALEDGTAHYETTKGKNAYTYALRG